MELFKIPRPNNLFRKQIKTIKIQSKVEMWMRIILKKNIRMDFQIEIQKNRQILIRNKR